MDIDTLPVEVEVLVEVPRGSFVKREAGQGIDYVSPVPCPFNYGCVEALPGADGDPVDVVLLGPARPLGARVRARVWGRVRFLDDGVEDDKWIAGPEAPGSLRGVAAFFQVYAVARRWMNRARGRWGRTAFLGIERRSSEPAGV